LNNPAATDPVNQSGTENALVLFWDKNIGDILK
jgi:hypothetical protein